MFGSNEITSALAKMGIKEPTEIQKKAIPSITNKKSIIAQSNTGTGKTMSFLIPLIDRLYHGEAESILILAPTRELVIQINNEANSLIENLGETDLATLPIYGGKDINAQINKLKKNKISIIVATPGRLLDHMNRGTIDLSEINCVVVDEADQMLLMGFRNEIDRILFRTKKMEQIIFLSATIDAKVKKLAYKYTASPEIITATVNNDIPTQIDQEFIFSTDRSKFDDLCDKLREDNPFMAIIFCRTKARVDKLDEKLAQAGFNCDKIHSDISQAKRERIIRNFRDMKIQLLISTDLASRGLDIEGITDIYNYDFPENPDDYVHRIGRTGRIGKEGHACSFITPKNESVYEEVQKFNK